MYTEINKTAKIFIINPVLTINGIVNLFVEKTIAFGGVEIGIIKAQLAAKIIGKVIFIIEKSLLIANAANIGRRRKVVAVLLINSVSIEVKKVRKRIIINKSYCLIKSRFFDKSSASPVETIILAIESPPPNKIKIFQGTSLYQDLLKRVVPLLSVGRTKNKSAHNIAIPESVS